MDIRNLKRNSKAIAAGIWIGDIPEMGTMRLLVVGLSAPAVAALQAAKERAVPRKDRHRDGRIKHSAALRISREVLFEAVLKDWDGISDGYLEDAEGNPILDQETGEPMPKPLPFDADLAKEWLTNPDYQDFTDAVSWAAMIADRTSMDAGAEIGGNSKT